MRLAPHAAMNGHDTAQCIHTTSTRCQLSAPDSLSFSLSFSSSPINPGHQTHSHIQFSDHRQAYISSSLCLCLCVFVFLPPPPPPPPLSQPRSVVRPPPPFDSMASAQLQEIARLRGHSDRVWHVAWAPNGQALASSSGDQSVRIWIPGRHPPPPSPGASSAPDADADGEDATAASPSTGGWEAATCADILQGTQHRTIRKTSWHPSGRLLAAASFDGTTCVWEKIAAEWEAAAVVEGHENEVSRTCRRCCCPHHHVSMAFLFAFSSH